MDTILAAQAHFPHRVVIVHGYGATPESHWFPWLAETLKKHGTTVQVVTLRDSEAPEAVVWERSVADALGYPDESTWIVAHSLGCVTALRVLASLAGPWKLAGVVLVAGFTGPLVALPVLNAYLDTDVDAEAVAKNIRTRIVVRSDSDPYVPAAATNALAKRLDAEMRIERNAGHFLAEDGVTELPMLIEALGGVHR